MTKIAPKILSLEKTTQFKRLTKYMVDHEENFFIFIVGKWGSGMTELVKQVAKNRGRERSSSLSLAELSAN